MNATSASLRAERAPLLPVPVPAFSAAPRPAEGVDPDLLHMLERVIDHFAYAGGTSGPRVAALAVLSQPAIAAALRAVDTLNAISDRHQPRTWAGSNTTVCDVCNAQWPCAERALIDGGTRTA